MEIYYYKTHSNSTIVQIIGMFCYDKVITRAIWRHELTHHHKSVADHFRRFFWVPHVKMGAKKPRRPVVVW